MKAEDFPAFFEALHGYPPFPWQERLMLELHNEGTWPEVIALPTGAGKTSVLDLAVFHLALQASLPPQARTAPRRIFFVIDRRIVVDEAFHHACLISERLASATSGILFEVARALITLASEADAPPLHVAVMRGGLYRDNHWARSPLQPTIVVSTVDQVGSRLLFRGYGLGRGVTRPIHAALVGVDSLIILDEAHLSHPFVQTLESVRSLQHKEQAWLHLPLTWTRMTATPGSDAKVFREDDQDRRHPVLGRRLSLPKLSRLDLVATKAATAAMRSNERAALAQANRHVIAQRAAELAQSLAAGTNAEVTGIILNEVATAREVFETLRAATAETGGEAVLLIGRSRPWDRQALLHESGLWERIRNGRTRRTDAKGPLFVVATQCVEVGADIDFDALVTECAALDALRQRFGRLNRGAHHAMAHAWIIGARHQVAGTATPHFVYGSALAKTWDWMQAQAAQHPNDQHRSATVDFATASLQALLPEGDALTALLTPRAQAPLLLPAHLDLLSHTFPGLAAEPEPALYLHGPLTAPPDVNLVWRADLDPARPDSWAATVALLPPSSAECLAMPVYAVRAWLAARPADVPDIEGVGSEPEPVGDEVAQPRMVLRWDGPQGSVMAASADIRPGDTLIVPSSYGGADCYGWNPASVAEVEDLAEPAALAQRGCLHLRLHPQVWRSRNASLREAGIAPQAFVENLSAIIADHDAGEMELTEVFAEIANTLAGATRLPSWLAMLRTHLEKPRSWWHSPTFYPTENAEPEAFIATLKRRLRPLGLNAGTTEFADEDDSSSEGSTQTLSAHSAQVASLARGYAMALGLPAELVESIALAAAWHDLGKADPRFQRLLGSFAVLDGGEVSPDSTVLLAKSGADALHPDNVPGWAQGFRHESLSLALAAAAPAWPVAAAHRDLALHLIASHHGRARPFLPVVVDAATGPVSMTHQGLRFEATLPHHLEHAGSGVADRFWALSRQFGHYGLAWLETLLRLADQRASREPHGTEDGHE